MYSKGKWTTRLLFDGFGEEVYMVESDGLLLARVYNKANAHLIAAAPELYEACKDLLKWSTGGVLDVNALKRINQALLKAEGK